MLQSRDYDFFTLNILNTILHHLYQCWQSNWKSEYCLSIYFCCCVQNVFDDVLLLNFRSRQHSLIFRSSCYAIHSTSIHRYVPAIRKFKRISIRFLSIYNYQLLDSGSKISTLPAGLKAAWTFKYYKILTTFYDSQLLFYHIQHLCQGSFFSISMLICFRVCKQKT